MKKSGVVGGKSVLLTLMREKRILRERFSIVYSRRRKKVCCWVEVCHIERWWDDNQIIYKGNELGVALESHLNEVCGILSQFRGAIMETGDADAS